MLTESTLRLARLTRRACLCACVLVTLAAHTARAADELSPPFGLRWGDSPEKLISWASRHSLDVNIFLPGDQPRIRVLRASARRGFLPETQAAELEARFLAGRLIEVTVHYHDPEWRADTVEERFQKLRQQVTSAYGELTPNRQERTVDDQFSTRKLAYHREPVKGLFLLLAYTEVEDLLRKTRDARFSLLYRNDNLRADIQRELLLEKEVKPPPAAEP